MLMITSLFESFSYFLMSTCSSALNCFFSQLAILFVPEQESRHPDVFLLTYSFLLLIYYLFSSRLFTFFDFPYDELLTSLQKLPKPGR